MLASALLALASIAASQFGTIKTVSGTVHRLSHGVVTALDKKSVGKPLLVGDSVKLDHGASLVVNTSKGTVPFKPSPAWQPLLTPLSAEDKQAYKTLQSAFDAAVIRRGGGFLFPSGMPVPCTLFTILGPPGPYRVVADDSVLYDRPRLDQAALAKAMLAARDARNVTSVTVTAGRNTVEVPLMPRDEETDLLNQLAAAAKREDGSARHLARASAFARHRLFEFARYEVGQLPKDASDAILTSFSRSIASVRAPG